MKRWKIILKPDNDILIRWAKDSTVEWMKSFANGEQCLSPHDYFESRIMQDYGIAARVEHLSGNVAGVVLYLNNEDDFMKLTVLMG